MKKHISKAALTAILAATLCSVSEPTAYAAETHAAPTITLNREPTEVRAKYINGDIYFSVIDYWTEVQRSDPTNIKWNEKKQLLSNGRTILSISDQTSYRQLNTGKKNITRFSDPVIVENGVVWAQASLIKDLDSGAVKDLVIENSDTSLNFKRTYWEFPGGKTYGYRLPLMQLDEETGLPDFLSVEQVRKKGSFSEKRFHILSQQLENGKTIYAYINKSDPHKFLLVTCVDGYVAHILDNNGIFTYDDYGTRCAE